jgi:hypothetical protein
MKNEGKTYVAYFLRAVKFKQYVKRGFLPPGRGEISSLETFNKFR